MEKKFKKSARITQLSALLVLFVAFGILIFNLFFTGNYYTDISKGNYFFNILVANSSNNLTFNSFGEFMSGIQLFKDSLILLSLFVLELIFILIVGSLRKRLKGYVKLAFIIFFQVLAYAVVIMNFFIYNIVKFSTPFGNFEPILLTFALFLQTVLLVNMAINYGFFSPFSIKNMFKRQTLLSFGSKAIKNGTIFLGSIIGIMALFLFGIYKVFLYALSQISLYNFFPSVIQFNFGVLVPSQASVLNILINSFSFDKWFLTVQNGIFAIDITAIDTKVHIWINNFLGEQFRQLIIPIIAMVCFYIIVNILSLIYKRVRYKNDLILIMLALVVFLRPFYLQSLNFILFTILDILITVVVVMFILIRIDDKFFAGKSVERISNIFQYKVHPWFSRLFKNIGKWFQNIGYKIKSIFKRK